MVWQEVVATSTWFITFVPWMRNFCSRRYASYHFMSFLVAFFTLNLLWDFKVIPVIAEVARVQWGFGVQRVCFDTTVPLVAFGLEWASRACLLFSASVYLQCQILLRYCTCMYTINVWSCSALIAVHVHVIPNKNRCCDLPQHLSLIYNHCAFYVA